MAKATGEVTRFVNYMHNRFAASVGTTFGACEANSVVVVVARANTDKAEQLRALVTQEWRGYIDQPRPRG